MSGLSEIKIAIVHDELVRRGGAEVVLEEMLRLLPQAEVYALYAGTPDFTWHGRQHRVHTSFLQRLPGFLRRHPSRLLPLLPHAAEEFDLSSYDLVISSASAFAKAIITRSTIPHVCYCHTPTRYAWDSTHEVIERTNRFLRWPARALLHYIRLHDFAAAQRVDFFIANSYYTKRRIEQYYRRDSTVIYPPIDTEFFTPPPGGPNAISKYTSPTLRAKLPFLLVGRLTASKRFEDAVRVCEKLGLPLRIVGSGRHVKALRRLTGTRTTLIGGVSNQQLREEYRSARALLVPGVEDFGMAAAEALACGTAVVGSGRGGLKEIVTDPRLGILYLQEGPEALAEGLRLFMASEPHLDPVAMRQQVAKFSRAAFAQNFMSELKNRLAASAEA